MRDKIMGFELHLSNEMEWVTRVYDGDNYVPLAVREIVSGSDYLYVDESNFCVFFRKRCGSVEEFVNQADEWRRVLRDRGERDLIYVR